MARRRVESRVVEVEVEVEVERSDAVSSPSLRPLLVSVNLFFLFFWTINHQWPATTL
jgi:hypothetical protein